MEPSVIIRYARLEDALVLFDWRNEPHVRRMFVNQERVSLEQHMSWVERTLTNQDCVLLIAETVERLPVGVVRFDIERSTAQAQISITVAPREQGKGYASLLLRGAIDTLVREEKNRSDITMLVAKVRHDNAPSLACFRRVGFKLQREDGEFKYLSRSLLG